MTVFRFVGLILSLAAAFPLLVQYIIQKDADKPISFWPADRERERHIADLGEYNRGMRIIDLVYGLLFVLTGIEFFIHPWFALVLFLLDVSAFFFLANYLYRRLLSNYVSDDWEEQDEAEEPTVYYQENFTLTPPDFSGSQPEEEQPALDTPSEELPRAQAEPNSRQPARQRQAPRSPQDRRPPRQNRRPQSRPQGRPPQNGRPRPSRDPDRSRDVDQLLGRTRQQKRNYYQDETSQYDYRETYNWTPDDNYFHREK